jgi:hypothetical protein
MFRLRDYQERLASECKDKIREYKICILNGEVRTGKTLTSIAIAANYNDVLFVTKIKAIPDIKFAYVCYWFFISNNYTDCNKFFSACKSIGLSIDYSIKLSIDYKLFNNPTYKKNELFTSFDNCFKLTIINYESLHKIQGVFDLVICDESHSIAAFPKPSKRTKAVKQFVSNDLLLLTGTLLPESNAQIFHQLWISPHSPYKHLKNFYAWHKTFGTPKLIYTSYGTSNDYSVVDYEKVKTTIDKLKVSITQKEAGFETSINVKTLSCEMKPETKKIMNKLRKDKVVIGKNSSIVADTPTKLMQKLHQLSSGTIIVDNHDNEQTSKGVIIDNSKIEFIKQKFPNKKLALFYFYKQERKMIFDSFKEDVTDDLSEFNTTDKHIALQQVSGAEGINLSAADVLIFINFGFSNTKFIQAKDRLTTKDRKHNDVYFILSDDGIDKQVYKSVCNKKDYVLKTFIRDEGK